MFFFLFYLYACIHVSFNTLLYLGRPPKAKSTCTMCNESKHPLNYVLPTQNGKKEFCSVNCLAEFRKEYVKVIIIVIFIFNVLFKFIKFKIIFKIKNY